MRDAGPCFYLYRQRMGEHVQTGVVAGASVAEYQRDLIKKHEHTRKDKEDDRTRHIDVLRQHRPGVPDLPRPARASTPSSRGCASAQPDVDFVARGRHRPHALGGRAARRGRRSCEALFAAVPHLYVADGHHRSAAASRVQQLRQARNPQPTGEKAYNFFLAVIFPHDQMKIMDYNRVVNDLNGLTAASVPGERSARSSSWRDASHGRARAAAHASGCSWRPLASADREAGHLPGERSGRSLDVAILQDNLLGPLLGIDDPRTDKRIDFVGGIRGTAELERRARAGRRRWPSRCTRPASSS